MLQHHKSPPHVPGRIVLLGANGFVARALMAHLQRQGRPATAIGRDTIDLAAPGAAERLANELRDGDTLVFLSATTPDKGRGITAFLSNVQMGASVCAAIEKKPPSHVVYISSDAVYPFQAGETNEESCAEPTDLYGAAHVARELMLRTACKCPLAILRPTMIYGDGDTHNSYGANRFRRMARKDGRIALFGDGEETRDHISINDVVALIDLVLTHKSSGTLNLVSGRCISFGDLARLVAAQFAMPVKIQSSPRQMPVTHRKFDASQVGRAFPQFRPTSLEAGIAAAHNAAD